MTVENMTTAVEPLPEWVGAGFELETYADGPPPNGFDELVGSFHYRRDGDRHEFLMQIEARHVNNERIAHGGLLAALTDIFCSHALWNHKNRRGNGFMTVSLSHEYVDATPEGRWLLSRCTIRREGSILVFIDCEMFAKDRLVGLSRCVMKNIVDAGPGTPQP